MERDPLPSLDFDPKTTALVLIDLQNGIVARSPQPHPVADVLANSRQLAAALRAKGGTAVYVRVEIGDLLFLPVDAPTRDPNAPPPAASASELSPDCGYQPGDVVITKRQWGAFHDTGLDQQLRRRHIRTILLGGIATNMGVESTARAAMDLGYHIVFVEDAMSSITAEAHEFAVKTIFPRMGRVRSTQEVLAELA